MKNLLNYKGCLVGGAIGDALGYPVEFEKYSNIIAKYGGNGITEYDLKNGKALISDDTQMTLFTATGLLFGTTRGILRGIMGEYYNYCYYSYIDWLTTQTGKSNNKGMHYSWLVNIKELNCCRTPGMTCLSALQSGKIGEINNPLNNSKGCGGVMRVASIGLFFSDEKIKLEDVAMIGAQVAAITHGHDLRYIPAAALTCIIKMVLQGENLEVAIDNVI